LDPATIASLLGGGLNFNSRPIARELTAGEINRLMEIDPAFWGRELSLNGVTKTRASFAALYTPKENWNFFDLIEDVFVPHTFESRFREVAGDKVKVY
jgi:hypothetical protein